MKHQTILHQAHNTAEERMTAAAFAKSDLLTQAEAETIIAELSELHREALRLDATRDGADTLATDSDVARGFRVIANRKFNAFLDKATLTPAQVNAKVRGRVKTLRSNIAVRLCNADHVNAAAAIVEYVKEYAAAIDFRSVRLITAAYNELRSAGDNRMLTLTPRTAGNARQAAELLEDAMSRLDVDGAQAERDRLIAEGYTYDYDACKFERTKYVLSAPQADAAAADVTSEERSAPQADAKPQRSVKALTSAALRIIATIVERSALTSRDSTSAARLHELVTADNIAALSDELHRLLNYVTEREQHNIHNQREWAKADRRHARVIRLSVTSLLDALTPQADVTSDERTAPAASAVIVICEERTAPPADAAAALTPALSEERSAPQADAFTSEERSAAVRAAALELSYLTQCMTAYASLRSASAFTYELTVSRLDVYAADASRTACDTQYRMTDRLYTEVHQAASRLMKEAAARYDARCAAGVKANRFYMAEERALYETLSPPSLVMYDADMTLSALNACVKAYYRNAASIGEVFDAAAAYALAASRSVAKSVYYTQAIADAFTAVTEAAAVELRHGRSGVERLHQYASTVRHSALQLTRLYAAAVALHQ